jgi:hypothetical protein
METRVEAYIQKRNFKMLAQADALESPQYLYCRAITDHM